MVTINHFIGLGLLPSLFLPLLFFATFCTGGISASDGISNIAHSSPSSPSLFVSSMLLNSNARSNLKPWEKTVDPNPVPTMEQLEESKTLMEEVEAALNRVIGTHDGIIIQRFRPQSAWLWKQWFGTVLYHSSFVALKNMAWAFCFCVAIRFWTKGDFQIWDIPNSSDYPRLLVVEKIWTILMGLTTFLLTFFVGQAYSFWRTVHDEGRGIQGRMNDNAMLMATSVARENQPQHIRRPQKGKTITTYNQKTTYTPEAQQFLLDHAQRMRVFHLLFWASNARRFRVLLTGPGLERMVEVGYLARAEKERLDELVDLSPTHKYVAVLESAFMHCQNAFRDPKLIRLPPSSAVEYFMVEQFCKLRGRCATIPDLVNGRMPLAYAHFVQILVDTFLVFAPVAQYVDLGIFSVISVGILTIFYDGLLDLAKVFLDPLDNEDYCERCVYLNLAVLIREANAASTRFMKGAALP